MIADGDRVPARRSFDAIWQDPEFEEARAEGAIAHWVNLRTVTAPRVRVNVMLDPNVLREVDQVARAVGKRRSTVIEEAIREKVDSVNVG